MGRKSRQNAKAQSGNILFLILLAVVLFAALSYAVTSSMRGGGNDSSSEKNTLFASNIVQYLTGMENTITRMRLTGGCKDAGISFENSFSTSYDYTHSPAAADSCKVFSPSGGNVAYQAPTDWFDTSIYSVTGLFWVNAEYRVQNVGTALPDLVVSIWGLKRDICQKINEKLGISGTSPPVNPIPNGQTEFKGVFASSPSDIIGTGSGAALAGHPAGCLLDGSSNIYVYYHVMLTR